ncbi:MAG: ATP-binding protein, partial [Salinivirgaceae bacterium]|nr:ATP-binding protein [Salinivirgaceae bacterium]
IKKYIDYNLKLDKANILLKEVNNDLIIAKKVAEENNQLKTTFLQNVSHEIRTPMNAIMGFSQLLERAIDNPENQKKYIKIVMYYGYELINVLDDILEISLIETKQITIKKNFFDINFLLNELYEDILQKLEPLNSLHLKINYNPAPVEFNFIYSDITKVNMIFKHLIKNALKYCNNGFVEYGFFNADGDSIIFYVADSGVGIPDEELQNIFERFRQVESKEQSRQGLGIGLSIVQGLLSFLDGKVWVESKVGVGSTFYFSLPTNIHKT